MPVLISIIPILFFGVIFVIGLTNTINPKIMWKTFESWKATKEPSPSYFLMRRIAGIIAMLIAISIFLFPFIISLIVN
jgi:hypothetical protein